MDIHGKTVQDRVDKALEEVKEQQSQLEKRGRAGSLQGQEMYLHTLEPASMTRQVIRVLYVCTCSDSKYRYRKVLVLVHMRWKKNIFLAVMKLSR